MARLNKKTKDIIIRMLVIVILVLVGIVITNQYILYTRISKGSVANADERAVRVSRLYEENKKLDSELAEKKSQLNELRDASVSSGDLRGILQSDINKYHVLSGDRIVEGSGVIIRVKHRMVLTQIIDFVNALRNSGLEAMSINEKRIIASTPLNDFDNEEDFIIKVIGNKDNLYSSLTRPGGIFELIMNGTAEKSDNIVLPKLK